jgi:beta-galactosidase
LFGGNINEFKMAENIFSLTLTDPDIVVPAHLWRGTIITTTGKPISRSQNEVFALRNRYGNGEVLWIPSLVGLGGRIKNDYSKLASLLNVETKESVADIPFRFKTFQPKMLMKTLRSGDSFITVIINKSKEKRNVMLQVKRTMNPAILFADKKGTVSNNTLSISPEETLVIQWK